MGALSKLRATFLGGRYKGDMEKATYDSNDNGVVDNSEKLEGSTKAQVQDHTAPNSEKLEGSTKVEVQDHTPKAHTLASHSAKAHSDLTGINPDVHGDTKVRTVEVDETNKADGKVLVYRSGSGKLEYEEPPGGASVNFIQQNVFNAVAPTVWTDLNLSAWIGSNEAVVCIMAKDLNPLAALSIRKNGSPFEFWSATSEASAQGIALGKHNGGNCMVLITKTDASGIIEWKAENDSVAELYLLWYIK